MAATKDRLKEIQDQLDLLMDELSRLRDSIASEQGRRRTYPYPFERSRANDEPIAEKPKPTTKH